MFHLQYNGFSHLATRVGCINVEDLAVFRPNRQFHKKLKYTTVTNILIDFMSVLSNVFCNMRGLHR